MFEFHPRSKSQAESNVMPHGDRQVKLLKWVQTLFIYCHLHHTHTPQKLTHTSATFHRLQFAVDTRCSSHGWRNAKLKKQKRGTKQKETALKKKSPGLRPAPAAALRLRVNNLSTFTLLLEAPLHSIHTLMDCQAAAAAVAAGELHAVWAAAFFTKKGGERNFTRTLNSVSQHFSSEKPTSSH